MSNNKKSSVEWLIEEIGEYFPDEIGGIELIVNKAKAMHKKEIVKSNEAGFDDGIGFIEEIKYKNAEDYYNKTFGGNNGHI